MMNKDINLLKLISQSKGYEVALFTTFNLDMAFFEKTIVNKLFDNKIKQVNLYVDSRQFNKTINEMQNNYMGKRYMINPVSINGAFHPKVVLLLGKQKARLIISSLNLTVPGYYFNNEVLNVYDFNEKETDYLNLITSAYNFFKEINKIAFYQDNSINNLNDKYLYLNKKNELEEHIFVDNLNENMIDVLKQHIDEDVTQIDIAVPYCDKELLAYQELNKSFNNPKINLYIQNDKSSFPIEFNEENNIVVLNDINIFNNLNINNKSKNFYHGKVFRFVTQSKEYMFYGSANCTMSALFKGYKTGGNIECNVLQTGELKSFDYYFDYFNVTKMDVSFNSKLMFFEPDLKSNFSFIGGVFDNDLKCTIKAKNDSETKIRTVTLTAKIEKYDGKFLEIKQNVVIEGPFSITHSNGTSPITNLDIPYGVTKSVMSLAGRVNYFNTHSPHSDVDATRVNSTYDITCITSAAPRVHEFTAKSAAGQVYKFNVTCKP